MVQEALQGDKAAGPAQQSGMHANAHHLRELLALAPCQAVIHQAAQAAGRERQGCAGVDEIGTVTAITDAAKAPAVKTGDVIVRVGKDSVDDYDDLYNALDGKKPGERVKVEVVREGQHVSLDVDLVVVQ